MSELIERLAKEAGIPAQDMEGLQEHHPSALAQFAALIAEECAKECDSMAEKAGTNRLQQLALDLAADAIRAKFPPPEVTG